jgi:ATP-dependent DNA ligase
LRFDEIHSLCASSRITTHANIGEIEYHVFDLIDESKNQMERLVALNNLYFIWPIVRVPFALISSLTEAMSMLDRYMAMGYEGIILRHCENMYQRSRSQLLMKFKPAKEDIYEIVSWKEETDKNGYGKETIGALVCKGETGNIFSCGSGLTDEISAQLWLEKESLVGRKLRVKYQHLTPGKQVPRFPVFVEVV